MENSNNPKNGLLKISLALMQANHQIHRHIMKWINETISNCIIRNSECEIIIVFLPLNV